MLRRVLLPALGLLALLPATAPAQPATPRIVGGTTTTVDTVPWQVAVFVDPSGTGQGFLCGGSIIREQTILTAAHCTIDPVTHEPFAASAYDVIAGTSDLSAPPQTLRGVTAVARHPNFDPVDETSDAALLQLDAPLVIGPTQQTIALASATPPAGTALTVSGWGTTQPVAPGAENTDPPSPLLRKATVNVIADGDPRCGPAYQGFLAPVTLCAAAANTDACQGDSGGPLADTSGMTPVLVGIVSGGAGCAQAQYAGLYTEVSATSIREFAQGTLKVPAVSAPPTLTGTARAGETITCAPGTWADAAAFEYEFFTNPGGTLQVLRGFTAGQTYAVGDGDVGRTIGCVVRATSSGGAHQTAVSNTVGPVAVRQVITRPPPVDTTRPLSTVLSRSCTRTTCRVVVSVDDLGFSAGIRGVTVKATTRYRVPCRRDGRRTTCARTRRSSPRGVAIGKGRYVVKLRNLPKGSSTALLVRAVDKAGNTQRSATRLTVRTRKRS